MAIYWTACFISICTSFVGTHTIGYKNGRKLSKFLTALISSLPLLLLAALRYGIGTDYFDYVEIYCVWIPRGGKFTIEPIFYYLNKLIYYFACNEYQWFFIISSIIYMFFTFCSIYRMSEKPEFSIFLLVAMTYYLSFFNTTREHIGCSILLYSVYYLEKKDIKRFIFWVVIATGFHYTCFLFAFALIFIKYELTPKKVLIWSCVFIASQSIIIALINKVLANSLRYSKYLYANNAVFSYNSILGVMIQLALLLLALYLYNYNKGYDKYNIFLGIQTFALWVNILSISMPMLSRVKWIFSMPAIIFIPVLVERIDNKKTRFIVFCGVCLAYIVYATISVGILHSFNVVPYKSIFSY